MHLDDIALYVRIVALGTLSAAARGDFHYEHADAFTYVPPQP